MGNDDLRGTKDDCMRLLFRQPPVAPLFGQRAGKTHWLVFMKGGVQ